MTKKSLWLIIPLLIVAILFITTQLRQRKVDMLIVNGTIYTMDSKNTIAQAIAIYDNLIFDVGTSEELVNRYRSDTIVDLKGAVVFPGFIDGHAHILSEGRKLRTLNLVGTSSAEQIAKMVESYALDLQAGQWIIGHGWDQNDWQNKNFPNYKILDKAAPYNPVLLRRVDGHAIWVNSKAMEIARITNKMKDPHGGKIHRDNGNNPTGIFIDNAIELIEQHIPPLTDDEIEQCIKLALNECIQLGLTAVHDMGVSLQTIRVYKKLIDRGECPIRIYAAIGDIGETWDYYKKHGPEIGYGNGMLTIRSIKLYMDGALGSRGAALVEEYRDDKGNRGIIMISEDSMETICQEALSKGFQVCTHAIGDRANHITLNIYEKVLKTLPKSEPSPRWRIEHAQVLLPDDISRFRSLEILPSMQPTHATSDMYWAEARIGPERIKLAYAWKSLLETGVSIIGGSDFPVESVNPLYGIYSAITRQDKEGYPPGGWYSNQKMSIVEAVKCFTSWAAYGSFDEKIKGTIEPGRWADITVFSKDIMKIAPNEILQTEVVMTIVGGKIVYQKYTPTSH